MKRTEYEEAKEDKKKVFRVLKTNKNKTQCALFSLTKIRQPELKESSFVSSFSREREKNDVSSSS